MFHKLNSGYSGSEIVLIKSWLNILVKSLPNLTVNNRYDTEMANVVRQFKVQNKAPLPDGIIDIITLYNIASRIDPAIVGQATRNNTALRTMLSKTPLVYDDEVHLTLTKALAIGAGFSLGDANAISISNKATDYAADSNPMPQGKGNAEKAYDVVSGANKKRLEAWHFVTEKRLQELDQQWRNSREQVSARVNFGRFMHAFQDSFSHQKLGPGIGQYKTRVNENGEVVRDWKSSEGEWHQVDDPSRRPELAYEMAQQSYNKLVEAAEVFRQKKWADKDYYPAVGWNSISGEVLEFCKDADTKSREGRAKKLIDRLTNARTGDSPREGGGKAKP